jgi:hypothetical protein
MALLPTGDELVLGRPVSHAVTGEGDVVHVLLATVDRPTKCVPHLGSETGEATRIEEGVGVRLAARAGPGELAVARLVREGAGWRVDPAFRAPMQEAP